VRNLPYQSPSDMEFPTGTETSMHMQAPDRSMTSSTVQVEGMGPPIATTVTVGKP
jgi:general secretion pathway protein D